MFRSAYTKLLQISFKHVLIFLFYTKFKYNVVYCILQVPVHVMVLGECRGSHHVTLKMKAARSFLGFDSRQVLGIFLFTTASRTALGPTRPPIQWVRRVLSLGVKRQGREGDHSPPSSTEVKNAWSYTSTPPYVFMAWCFVKHRDNFTFTFYGPPKRWYPSTTPYGVTTHKTTT
jgi:hypothetical protein